VKNRQALDNLNVDGEAVPPAFPTGDPTDPEPWESGFKDTVISYPGQVTRINAKFDVASGQVLPATFVWHCHILEHEDNEMMRPYQVVAAP
jgi:FtsP/CotA-like multicopper oxidase with cupredoxin domain